MLLCQEVAQVLAHKLVEVVVNKVSLVEEEVVVQREVQVVQRYEVDHLQVHQYQIRTTLNATRTIIIALLDDAHMQISRDMFVETRGI